MLLIRLISTKIYLLSAQVNMVIRYLFKEVGSVKVIWNSHEGKGGKCFLFVWLLVILYNYPWTFPLEAKIVQLKLSDLQKYGTCGMFLDPTTLPASSTTVSAFYEHVSSWIPPTVLPLQGKTQLPIYMIEVQNDFKCWSFDVLKGYYQEMLNIKNEAWICMPRLCINDI